MNCDKVMPIDKWVLSSEKSCRQGNVDRIYHAVSGLSWSFDINNDELYLVIDESVTNAMEHGNKWDG
ncbi:MAG: hypothetical protein ACRCUT_15115, partial [Spirochaetota bacterium]